jgi:hypothetical protein
LYCKNLEGLIFKIEWDFKLGNWALSQGCNLTGTEESMKFAELRHEYSNSSLSGNRVTTAVE